MLAELHDDVQRLLLQEGVDVVHNVLAPGGDPPEELHLLVGLLPGLAPHALQVDLLAHERPAVGLPQHLQDRAEAPATQQLAKVEVLWVALRV